jgi:hypothetical protein
MIHHNSTTYYKKAFRVFFLTKITIYAKISLVYIQMPKASRKYKKPSSKRTECRRKKQKGGVSFNGVLDMAAIPSASYYPLNSYQNDPQNPSAVVDSRILGCSTADSAIVFGGKKGRKTKRKRSTKRHKKRKTRGRRQKGGNLLGYSNITGLSTGDTSLPMAFGTGSGTNYIKDLYIAQAPMSNALTAQSSISTLA